MVRVIVKGKKLKQMPAFILAMLRRNGFHWSKPNKDWRRDYDNADQQLLDTLGGYSSIIVKAYDLDENGHVVPREKQLPTRCAIGAERLLRDKLVEFAPLKPPHLSQ